MKDGAVEVTEAELFLEEAWWVSEKEHRKEAVLRLPVDEGGKAGGEDSLVERKCVEVRTLFSGVSQRELGEGGVG